jgi:hypothetical protein
LSCDIIKYPFELSKAMAWLILSLTQEVSYTVGDIIIQLEKLLTLLELDYPLL